MPFSLFSGAATDGKDAKKAPEKAPVDENKAIKEKTVATDKTAANEKGKAGPSGSKNDTDDANVRPDTVSAIAMVAQKLDNAVCRAMGLISEMHTSPQSVRPVRSYSASYALAMEDEDFYPYEDDYSPHYEISRAQETIRNERRNAMKLARDNGVYDHVFK